MTTIWLALLCGVGCLSAAISAVLLTGERRPAVAFGGASAFIAVLLVLVCAGVSVMRLAGWGPAEGEAQRMLEQMIEQEVR